ncbi:hypothetical protein TWF696_000133 [Orbilia brochopaga]|uniref:Uncharacterized protein n=1 Tax=Orbilia brochopaga TaxID=3140254 RepID=A0AAV9VCV9_9PEZI
MTLTSWRECVDYNYLWHVARLGNNQINWSFCSFSADFIEGYWSIRSTANPQMIDIWDRDLYPTINDPTRRPRIEFGKVWESEWGSFFQYLTMGTAARDSGNRVKWTAYRPVSTSPINNGGMGRRAELLADGNNPTFEDLHRLGNGVNFDLADLGGVPLSVSGDTEGREVLRFPGSFPVIEVKGKSDADLQHGDFLVLRGGGFHLQVCFQEMATRGNDGQFITAIKPSFIEYYTELQPPPENRPGVVGCKEIVLQVYKDIDTRIEPIPLSPTEESQLIQEFTGLSPGDLVQPKIEIDAHEGFTDSPYFSEPVFTDPFNRQPAPAQDGLYAYTSDENNVKLEEEEPVVTANQRGYDIFNQNRFQQEDLNIGRRFPEISSPRTGIMDTVPRFLPDLRQQSLFFGGNNGQINDRDLNSVADSLEELLRSDPEDEIFEVMPTTNFQAEDWPWPETPVKIEEGEEDQMAYLESQPRGMEWFDNPFSRANRQNNPLRMTDEYRPPLGQRGLFGYSNSGMSGGQQSQPLSGLNSRFSSPDVIRERQQRGQMIEEEYDEEYWPVPEEEPLQSLTPRQMAVIQRLLYEQAQQRASENQPN